jgi:hypothetical protein
MKARAVRFYKRVESNWNHFHHRERLLKLDAEVAGDRRAQRGPRHRPSDGLDAREIRSHVRAEQIRARAEIRAEKRTGAAERLHGYRGLRERLSC